MGILDTPGLTKKAAGTELSTKGTPAQAAVERMFQQVENKRLLRFAKTNTATWADGSGWAAQLIDNTAPTRIIGTKNAADGLQVGYFDTAGWTDTTAAPTWTSVKTFTPGSSPTTDMNAEACVQLASGELLIATSASGGYWGQIYRTAGWVTDPATATWTMVNRSPFARLATVPSGDYKGLAYDGGSRLMAAWYGTKASASTAASAAGVQVRYTSDGGTTWTDVFDLSTWLTSQGVNPVGLTSPNGYHVHSVAYDRYWDAWWISFGDTDGTTGRSGYLYSLDNGATWTAANFGAGSWQSVSIYPMLDCVLFLGDGGTSSGANRLARDPGSKGSIGALTKGYSGGMTTAIGETGWANPEPGGWLLLPFTQISGSTRVSRLIGTVDGTTFHPLYIDPTYTVSGVSGLHRVVGQLPNGKIVGTSTDNRYAGGTSLLTLAAA